MAAQAEKVVRMERVRRDAGPGGMLTDRDRELIQAIATGGIPAVAEMLGTDEVRAERVIAEIMWGSDARAYLARLMDARVVGILAPLAVTTVADLMGHAASDRTRLAAAQTALQLVGVLGTHAGMGGAAVAAERAAAEGRGLSQRFEGLSAKELLDKVDVLEAQLVEQGLDDRLRPGDTVEGGW